MTRALVACVFALTIVGCPAPRRPAVPSPVTLTWPVTMVSNATAQCVIHYLAQGKSETAAERYCNCYIPELMRASPKPDVELASGDVEKAVAACEGAVTPTGAF